MSLSSCMQVPWYRVSERARTAGTYDGTVHIRVHYQMRSKERVQMRSRVCIVESARSFEKYSGWYGAALLCSRVAWSVIERAGLC
jgi:hypothetical protein